MRNTILATIGGRNVRQSLDQSLIFFRAGMTIDADGSPRAYHPQSSRGLDALANAGHPGNWWGLAKDPHGQPYLQTAANEAPGYYVSTTSLEDATLHVPDPRRYVNSERLNFIVRPGGLAGLREGQLCSVFNTRNNRLAHGVVADQGPANHLGEASIAQARALGIPSDPRTGGTADPSCIYLIYLSPRYTLAQLRAPADLWANPAAEDAATQAHIDRLASARYAALGLPASRLWD